MRLKAAASNQGVRVALDAHSGDNCEIEFLSSGVSQCAIRSDEIDAGLIFKVGGTGGAAKKDAFSITSAGNVGMGLTAPQQQLQVHNAGSGSSSYAQFTQDGTGATSGDGLLIGINANEQAIIYHQEDTDLILYTNQAERMRITNGGNVLILANTGGDGFLKINGTGANDTNIDFLNDDALKWRIRNKGNESDRLEIRDSDGDNGVIMAKDATEFSSGSDERLKCNWTSFDNALSDINSLTKVGTFQYKNFGEDEPRNDKVHSGLSAQEVQKFLPSAVTADKEGEKFLYLSYQSLIPVLVKAVQELSAKVKALEDA